MCIETMIAKARLHYHLNMIDVVGVLDQLHVISGETAERRKKHHTMTLFTDVFPRLGYDIFKEKEDEG